MRRYLDSFLAAEIGAEALDGHIDLPNAKQTKKKNWTIKIESGCRSDPHGWSIVGWFTHERRFAYGNSWRGERGGEVILVKIHRVGHGTIGENWPRLPLPLWIGVIWRLGFLFFSFWLIDVRADGCCWCYLGGAFQRVPVDADGVEGDFLDAADESGAVFRVFASICKAEMEKQTKKEKKQPVNRLSFPQTIGVGGFRWAVMQIIGEFHPDCAAEFMALIFGRDKAPINDFVLIWIYFVFEMFYDSPLFFPQLYSFIFFFFFEFYSPFSFLKWIFMLSFPPFRPVWLLWI